MGSKDFHRFSYVHDPQNLKYICLKNLIINNIALPYEQNLYSDSGAKPDLSKGVLERSFADSLPGKTFIASYYRRSTVT